MSSKESLTPKSFFSGTFQTILETEGWDIGTRLSLVWAVRLIVGLHLRKAWPKIFSPLSEKGKRPIVKFMHSLA